MARGTSVIDIIINTRADASGINDVSLELADAARGWAAFEGVNFLTGVTEGAAALAEAQQTVDVVFGSSAATIRDFGEGAAESIGLGERAALSAAGNFGTLFAGMEVGQDQAAQMSERMLQLAADMSAARNVPLDEAITAIFSGLSGEQEPLKRFGVLLNEAAVKQKALEMGLYSGTGAISAAGRAQATYALILDKTSTMHGAAAREMGGLLGQQKQATAEWENAKDELGQNFIPTMTAATKVLSEGASAFGGLEGSIQLGIVAAIAWTAVGARATTMLVGLGNAAWTAAANLVTINWAGTASGASSAATSISQLNKTTVGLAAVTAGVVAFAGTGALLDKWSESKQVNADIEQLTVALEGLANTGAVRGELAAFGTDLDKIGEAFRNLNKDRGDVATDLAKGLVPVVGPLWAGSDLTDADAAKDTIDEIDKALANLMKTDPEAARAAYAAITGALTEQGIAVDEVVTSFDDYWSASESSGIAAENEAESTDESTAAHRRQYDAIQAANEILGRRVDRAQSIISATDGVRSAEDAAADAAENLADAHADAAAGSDQMRAAHEAEVDAAEGVKDAQKGVADALEGVKEAQEGVRDAEREVLDRRKDLNEAYADAVDKIDDLARASRQASLDEAQAVLDVRGAQEELNRILADSSASDLEKDQARQDLAEAIAAKDQAAADAAQARIDASNARNPENDEGVISAKDALADSIDGVRDAQDRVTEASERVADAQKGVVDAEKRVQDARRNTAKVTQEARERVREAEEASRDATLNLIRAQSDLTTAVNGTKAGITQQRDALIALAESFAPGSTYREYLEGLIDLLSGALEAGNIPQDESRDPVGNGRRPQTTPPRSNQDESRDPVQRRPQVVFQTTVIGSEEDSLRRLDQHQRRFADQLARGASGG